MRTWCRSLALSAVLALALPAAAHAQFFGGAGPWGWGGVGAPYGTWGGWGGGWRGWGGGWGGGWAPYYYGGSYVTPIIITYSTPAAEVAPRMRAALWPAIPYRDTAAGGTAASIDIHVPAVDAQVCFDGVVMQQTGLDRHYVTPPLVPGETYAFDVRCTWNDAAGVAHTRTRRVHCRAGNLQVVDFLTGS